MGQKEDSTISSKVSNLKILLENAFEKGVLSKTDFDKPAKEEELLNLENHLKTRLPNEFRAFCLQIARVAPCPYTPMDKSFPELKMNSMDSEENINFLWGGQYNPFDTKIFNPFPLTKTWERTVPYTIFGKEKTITQIYDTGTYDRNIVIDPLVKGESPFDGLYELFSEIHYCDSFFMGYYLVIRGQATGQIWMCHTQIVDGNEPNMIFKPLAPTFLDWYIAWLKKTDAH